MLNSTNQIILRHDVDLDIYPAYKMALLENEIGVKSTFFILLNAQSYNPLSINNKNILREISSLGFEIGLHFDPTNYSKKNISYLNEMVKKEINILSDISLCKVESISLHSPSTNNEYPIFNDYNNAYDKNIFMKDSYLSDSRMMLPNNPYEFVKNAKTRTIQLNFHPLHYSENGDNYDIIMKKYFSRHVKNIDSHLGVMRATKEVWKIKYSKLR